MKRAGRAVILGVLAACLCAAARAQPASPPVSRITWISGAPSERPGLALEREPFSLRLAAFIETRWPGVDHGVVTANALRAVKTLTEGEQACVLAFAHTPERERLAYFRDALLVAPPVVVVRRDKLAALPRDAAGEVDLARLFADRALRGAVVSDRSYGSFVDGQVRAAPGSGGLSTYAANDFGSSIPAMVALGRLDYSVVLEIDVELGRRSTGPGALVGVPILGANTPGYAGVACPRTPWGQAVIRRVDTILSSPEGAALLRRETGYQMTPAARQRFAAQFDAPR
ncbi:MAG: hypothetical protein JO224_12415 [Pelomonas sp.]|nr:hypothetical protein [Roseateles sp.]